MAAFHPLTVTAVDRTIRDAVRVTLQPPEGADFSFTAGQYLTFRKDFDGEEIRRSYSICCGEGEGVLQVGIKRVDGGAFSTWVNEELAPGDVLEAMPPMGKFHVARAPGKARHYLAFAGGSGITPILSIIKTVMRAEPLARFTLVYANRAVNTIMFRQELEDVKNENMGRFQIIHVLEEPSDMADLFIGRVDGEKCAALFDKLIDPAGVDIAFICGPEPMMMAIRQALRDHGVGDDRIKFELFASAQTGRLKRRAQSAKSASAGEVQASITIGGASHSFTMRRDMTVLEAAMENDLDPPHACRAGVCSTCICRVEEGEVDMVTNHALEDGEVARGYVLSCQSYPVSEWVKLVFEDH